MPLVITVPGMSLSGLSNVRYAPPVLRGAEYMNFMTEGQLTRNLISGKPAAEVQGSPVFTDGIPRFLGAGEAVPAYIKTQVMLSQNFTWLVCARPVLDADTWLVGNIATTSTVKGAQFWLDDNGVSDSLVMPRFTTRQDNDGTLVHTVLSAAASISSVSPILYCVRYNSATKVKTMNRLNAGSTAVVTTTETFDIAYPSTNGVRIGSAGSALISTADILGVALHSVCLTDPEMELQAAALRAYAAQMGVTV